MEYIENELGDILCKNNKGKEKYIARPSVEKGDPDNPKFKGTNYLKGFAPVRNSAGIQELAKEIVAEINEAPINNAPESNIDDRSTNYNTTNAIIKMKEMDKVDLDTFVSGDDRKTVIKALNELK